MPSRRASCRSMHRLFFDTNVLLDVLEQRPPWFPESFACLARVESGACSGALSAVSLSDIAYLQKRASSGALYETFRNLRSFVQVASMSEPVVDRALARQLPDLEDGLQFEAALAWGATHLITRNAKDFPRNDGVRVQTPAEYLAQNPSD